MICAAVTSTVSVFEVEKVDLKCTRALGIYTSNPDFPRLLRRNVSEATVHCGRFLLEKRRMLGRVEYGANER